jgi:hypothetical protein
VYQEVWATISSTALPMLMALIILSLNLLNFACLVPAQNTAANARSKGTNSTMWEVMSYPKCFEVLGIYVIFVFYLEL